MTCIVGIVDHNKVYIGGDSAGVSANVIVRRSDAKVFINSGFIFGFTSSFRMGNLLQYSLKVPEISKGKPIHEYMCVDFVNAVRTCFKEGGFTQENRSQELGGTFLVGFKNKLFEINGDFQVGCYFDNYAAVGCGQEFALGSLFSTKNQPVEKRIKLALGAAAYNCTGVRPPFKIIHT